MITIIAKSVVKPDCLAKFKDIATPLIVASRREDGCLEYNLHQDLDRPEILTFIERWRDQAAIDEHFKTAHFIAALPQLQNCVVAPIELNMYQVI